ncbi:MAG: hypothetical protein WC437_05005 [Patescibacteria group bacterium]|jgi:hypothetical protein
MQQYIATFNTSKDVIKAFSLQDMKASLQAYCFGMNKCFLICQINGIECSFNPHNLAIISTQKDIAKIKAMNKEKEFNQKMDRILRINQNHHSYWHDDETLENGE